MRESSVQKSLEMAILNQSKTQIIFQDQKNIIIFFLKIMTVDIAQAVVALKLHHRSPSRRFVYFRRPGASRML